MTTPSLFRGVSMFGRARVWMLAALAAMAGGCATGEYTYVKTTSYGDKLHIPLERGMPIKAEKDGVKIDAAVLMPSRDTTKKEAFYVFGFTDQSGVEPKSVKVEDVSDEEPITIVEDLAPKYTPGNHWSNTPRMMTGDDPVIGWTRYVGDAFRVFRFTITKPDGREIILHQGMSVPAWMKLSMRRALGHE